MAPHPPPPQQPKTLRGFLDPCRRLSLPRSALGVHCSKAGCPQVRQSLEALAPSRPPGGDATGPASYSYTYASRALQACGPADLRRRATWRLRESGHTRAGVPGPAVVPEGRCWLRRR